MYVEIGAARRYRHDIRQDKLISSVDFEKDEIICRFRAGEELELPTRSTVQISEDRHIILEPEILGFLNHSCDPNVFLDTESLRLEALRPIRGGDELAFFYPSTEWEMAEPFSCGCGAPSCLGTIRGASHVSLEVLVRYRLNAHIVRLIGARSNRWMIQT